MLFSSGLGLSETIDISEDAASSSSSKTLRKEERLDSPALERLPREVADMRLELLPLLLCPTGDPI